MHRANYAEEITITVRGKPYARIGPAPESKVHDPVRARLAIQQLRSGTPRVQRHHRGDQIVDRQRSALTVQTCDSRKNPGSAGHMRATKRWGKRQ